MFICQVIINDLYIPIIEYRNPGLVLPKIALSLATLVLHFRKTLGLAQILQRLENQF